jgi:DegV family protein with EDD domain
MKIITDTGSLISKKEAEDLDIALLPLQVEVDGKNYHDYLDISTEDFYQLTKTKVAHTSLPSMGDVMDIYQRFSEGIHICIARGLSSSYDTAATVIKQMNVNITLFNSKGLIGTQRYLVLLAQRLSFKHTASEITQRMDQCLSQCQSFLIPVDFDFLKRTGRLSPLAATLGGMMSIKPIITHVPGMEKLDKFGVGRTWHHALDQIVNKMSKNAVDLKHKVYITHALNIEMAQLAVQKVRERFNNIEIELLTLSPTLMALGGPGCVAVQYILKDDAD